MLTVPDGAFGEPYERIDAGSRWAGLAAIDGAMLRETAGLLRDWDLQSTLFRRALQAGARHVPAEGRWRSSTPAPISPGWSGGSCERRRSSGGWASRLLAPVERVATYA